MYVSEPYTIYCTDHWDSVYTHTGLLLYCVDKYMAEVNYKGKKHLLSITRNLLSRIQYSAS